MSELEQKVLKNSRWEKNLQHAPASKFLQSTIIRKMNKQEFESDEGRKQ
jgi:hypothetical protein